MTQAYEEVMEMKTIEVEQMKLLKFKKMKLMNSLEI